MDINQVGIQEPKGFDDDFNNGFPITELENNEIEVPYYESGDDESETSQLEHYDTESDYASSDETVVSKKYIVKINRNRPTYKTLLCMETDFLPE